MKICIHREPQNVVKIVSFGQDDGWILATWRENQTILQNKATTEVPIDPLLLDPQLFK
jgi:hypothetical protein